MNERLTPGSEVSISSATTARTLSGSGRVAPKGDQDGVQLVGLDQDVAGLGPLAGANDAPALHQVHQPPGLGETHPELALEHRGGAELGGDHELDRLAEQVQVVADVAVDLPPAAG